MDRLDDKNYTHVFFDLDHTLWDYNKNAFETLDDLYQRYEIGKHFDEGVEVFIDMFYKVNNSLWDQFHLGEIDKSVIRERRFKILSKELGINQFDSWESFQNDFIAECPTKGHLFEGAIEVLEYLKESYALNLITNGFADIQSRKLQYSGIQDYFEYTITSEMALVQKPHPGIFNLAMEKAVTQSEDSIMIGDDQHSDIFGAKSVNMDQVLFNPNSHEVKQVPTHEIRNLKELIGLL